jgi:S-adenosylmethionine:tRNA ribosyltransferase-isomerase
VKLADFDYALPPERIAARPAERRDAARLLVHDVAADATTHTTVSALDALLEPGDLLVVNDTRVVPARVLARRATGGAVELLFLGPDAEPGPSGQGRRVWLAMAHPGRRLKAGETLAVEGGAARVLLFGRAPGDGREWRVELLPAEGDADASTEALLERVGHVPLPPYIERPDDALDRERYQTVYAAAPGAIAAPTAGLHFTPELLARLDAKGIRRAAVTLHVGAGTFLPVKVDDPREHRMQAERYELPAETARLVAETRARGGRVVAVGTTVVRVLETCASKGVLVPETGETRLFLLPGAEFRVVDVLMTNFHLPKSTLLMLVSAFAGRERVLRLYREAIEAGYRFYSYGDAMLLVRDGSIPTRMDACRPQAGRTKP